MDLRSTPLFTEDVVAVLAADHVLATKHTLKLSDVSQTDLLLPTQDNPLYAHIADAFSHAGLRMNASFEVGSSNLVQAMAAARVGVALVPATAAATDDQTVGSVATTGTAIRRIEDMPPRMVAITSRSSFQPSRAVVAVEAILADTARQAATSMTGCKVILAA